MAEAAGFSRASCSWEVNAERVQKCFRVWIFKRSGSGCKNREHTGVQGRRTGCQLHGSGALLIILLNLLVCSKTVSRNRDFVSVTKAITKR